VVRHCDGDHFNNRTLTAASDGARLVNRSIPEACLEAAVKLEQARRARSARRPHQEGNGPACRSFLTRRGRQRKAFHLLFATEDRQEG
jgi:hypothetical protein